MSVEHIGDPESNVVRFYGDDAPLNCFWCGHELPELVVHWHGSGSHVSLHRQCAEKLSIQLAFEAKRLDFIERQKPLTSGLGGSLGMAAIIDNGGI